MAMNKFMHSKNIYNTPPDFAKLAEDFEDFRTITKTTANGKVRIDFKDEAALKTLTKCLLKRDFDLTVNLPPKQLVPTLSLRLNYILWIEDIIGTFKLKDVMGLDIGCGASCIYPLLATRRNPAWQMVGIELNEESVQYARENIKANALEERIRIIHSTSTENPFDGIDPNENTDRFDFTMCNPPFFQDETEPHDDKDESDFEAEKQRIDKQKPPNNAKTGISCELMTAGGEVEFVKKIIQKSKEFGKSIKIFTTMLGHKSSSSVILQEVKNLGITNYCTSEFCQGWTKRWGIAWTFRNDLPLRLVPVLGQTQPKPPHRFLPNDVDDADLAAKKLCRILSKLTESAITNQEKTDCGERFQFIALSNSWKNQRRLRREQARAQQSNENKSEATDELDNVPEKRIRLGENDEAGRIMETLKCNDSPPLLHIEVNVESKTVSELKAIVEIKLNYLNGTSGLNGVYELLQYIQNKWSQ